MAMKPRLVPSAGGTDDRTELEEIRRRIDFHALVSETVPLRKAGKSYKGLCPFHREKSPSFHVNAQAGLYKCFGCGKAGDLFRWVMEVHGMTFPEALDFLARRAGVALKKRKRTEEDDVRTRILSALEAAAAYYEKALAARSGEAARAYLEKRGIRPETSEAFRLGFAPRAGRALLDFLIEKKAGVGREGYPAEILEAAGLVRSNERGRYDFFRGRLIFPIRDLLGRVVGFGGRVLDDGEPKYINTAETEVFKKSSLLYGLHEGREAIAGERRAVLVEGYLDVILMHQADFRLAVAPLGTSFTEGQAAEIRRRADAVVVTLDADAAGERASVRAIELSLEAGLDVRVARLSGGKDPADLVAAGETESLARALTESKDAAGFLISRVVRPGAEKRMGAAERSRGADEIARILAILPDPLYRSAQVHDTATALGVGADALAHRVEKFRRERLAERAREGAGDASARPSEEGRPCAPAPEAAGGEARLVRFAAIDVGVRRLVAERNAADDLSDPLLAEILGAILASEKEGIPVAGDLGGRLSGEALSRFAGIMAQDEPVDDPVMLVEKLLRRIRRRRIDERIRGERDPVRLRSLLEEKRKCLEVIVEEEA